jgi:hypothetical protein
MRISSAFGFVGAAIALASTTSAGCSGCGAPGDTASSGGGQGVGGAGGFRGVGGSGGVVFTTGNYAATTGSAPPLECPGGPSWPGDDGPYPAPHACAHLAVDAGLVTLSHAGVDLAMPSLVSLGGSEFAVVYGATPPQEGAQARFARFDASGAWPPVPSPTVIYNLLDHGLPAPGATLLAARRAHAHNLMILYDDYAGISSYPGPVDPSGCLVGYPAGDESPPGDLLYIAPTAEPNGFVFGVSTRDGPYRSFNGGTLDGYTLYTVACATTPVAADWADLGSSWFLGLAAGTDLLWLNQGQSCATNFGTSIGPATRLVFAKLGMPSDTPAIGTSWTTAAPVTRVRLAASSAGTWATWSLDDGSFAAATLDMAAQGTVLDVTLPPEADVSTYDAHPLGTGFAVAAAAPTGVEVHAFRGSGVQADVASIPIAGSIVGDVRLNATDALDALFVAWADDDGAASAIHVARVRCVP